MTIYLKQGSVVTEVGPQGILHSLFSTIAVRLEDGKWGSRFPVIMNVFYQGKLDRLHADTAFAEMKIIREELKAVAPKYVVWDIENLDQEPPWAGVEIASHVTSAQNYFATTYGRNLVDEIAEGIDSLLEFGGIFEIVSTAEAPFTRKSNEPDNPPKKAKENTFFGKFRNIFR